MSALNPANTLYGQAMQMLSPMLDELGPEFTSAETQIIKAAIELLGQAHMEQLQRDAAKDAMIDRTAQWLYNDWKRWQPPIYQLPEWDGLIDETSKRHLIDRATALLIAAGVPS